jgi:WD40 repeat protein
VLSRDSSGEVRVWSTQSGSLLHVVNVGPDESPVAAAFGPGGATLATISQVKEPPALRARVWDAESWKERAPAQDSSAGAFYSAYCPDGLHSVFTWERDAAEMVLLNDKPRRRTFRSGRGVRTHSVSIHVRSGRLLMGADDGTTTVFDIQTAQPIIAIPGHRNAVRATTFAPDGRTFATCSDDGTAQVYLTSVPDLVELAERRLPANLSSDERKELVRN